MKYIQSPDSILVGDLRKNMIFLAGGFSGPDWREEMKRYFAKDDVVLVNPKRVNFDSDKISAKWQTKWDRVHLSHSNILCFWFPKETFCPITLFEFGYWVRYVEVYPLVETRIFYGCDISYPKREDIKEQVSISNRGGKFGPMAFSVKELAAQIKGYIANKQ